MGWAIIPYDKYSMLADINIGVLYLFAILIYEKVEEKMTISSRIFRN